MESKIEFLGCFSPSELIEFTDRSRCSDGHEPHTIERKADGDVWAYYAPKERGKGYIAWDRQLA